MSAEKETMYVQCEQNAYEKLHVIGASLLENNRVFVRPFVDAIFLWQRKHVAEQWAVLAEDKSAQIEQNAINLIRQQA